VAETECDARITVFILPHGQASIEQSSQGEKQKIESTADIEKGLIEKWAFPSE
jgi:hypothetical protein